MLSSGHASMTDLSSSLIKAGDSLPTRDWSSLIGIITAICGNILISFALNTQRYAHLRLSRKREEDEEKQRNEHSHSTGKSTQSSPNGYGTSLNGADRQAQTHQNAFQRDGRTDEETPLLSQLGEEEAEENEPDAGDLPRGEGTKEKSYLKSPVWWLGIALMVVGEAGNFLAYGFAPASIVSPLGVVALISNCLIAPLLLGEEFRWRDGLGVIIAIGGCVTVVLSASTSNPRLTPGSIWHLITRWEFETYLGITAALIIALTVASNRYGDRTVLIDLGLVGLFGGYTALSTKGIASLLSNKVWRVITFPITYLLLSVLVFTAVMQIKYLNRALQRFNATVVIPTQFVLFTLSVIIGSAVLYRDFERQETENAIKFVGGCALTFLGVWCITSGRRSDEDNGNHSDEEDSADEDLAGQIEPTSIKALDTAPPSRPLVTVTSSSDGDSTPIPKSNLLKPGTITPANAAAIHAETAGELPAPPLPQPVHATTSEPIVPTRGALAPEGHSQPFLGRNKTSSSPHRRPATRPQISQRNSAADANLESNLGLQQNRLLPSTAGLFPGPLTTTLSSSLSAIVADSLRRGVDNIPAHTLSPARQRPGSIGRAQSRRAAQTLNSDATSRKRHSIASGDMPVDASASETGTGADVPTPLDAPVSRRGRMRSLSATLGDLFGVNSNNGEKGSKDRHADSDAQGTGER